MKFKLLFVFLFIVQLTQAQSIVTLINKSNTFFDLLDQAKFEDATGMFDASLKDKVNPDLLKQFWTGIKQQLGDFQSVENAQNRVQGEYYMVILQCKFANGSESFMFTYNKTEKILGFVIVPKNPEVVYIDPPYSDSTLYKETFITVKPDARHELAGMLTVPKTGTNFPIVVLVHGSGPNDMDETIGANKPFRDLALGLAAKGIATLRYVKRTRVYANEFKQIPTVKEEVLDDALAVIALARTTPGIDKKQIYVFGHSLGGMLAPKLATLAPDLKGIILAAAPARKITDLMVDQNKYFYERSKDTTAAGKKQYEANIAALQQTRLLKLGAIKADSMLFGAPASYWIDLNNYDQVAAAKKLQNRILVVQGEHDFQVSALDYNIWKTALASNKNAAFKLYPDLNHILIGQTEKGDASQYQKTGNVAAYLVSDIAAWIKTGK